MKKVLVCTEASFLPTGYGVYGKELLTRLSQIDDLEVAELSCYTDNEDKRFLQIPWKAYANKPTQMEQEALKSYFSDPLNEYGEFSFNTVCLNFQPDIVIDFRDPWMFEYQTRSPFRNFFYHIIMPTVDAMPQNTDWINMFNTADKILTYTEFGKQTLLNQSNIKIDGIAPAAASKHFRPLKDNEKILKNNINIHEGARIIGTVMRNQRRKLYPELFESFAKLRNVDPDIFLYCHTGFPDVGWNIPELLMKYGLSSSVLFTYKCKSCNYIQVLPFRDNKTYCGVCKKFNNEITGVHNGITDEELNQVYNCFDVYVQYANSEGFGMPVIEAANAGIPIVTINYSAMGSIGKDIRATLIEPAHFVKEAETGCLRAIPNNNDFLNTIRHLLYNINKKELQNKGLNSRELALSKYSWDNTAKKWIDVINTLPKKNIYDTWLSPPRIQQPSPIQDIKKPYEQTNFLIEQVLCKPELKYGILWKRFIKDLTYCTRVQNLSSEFYYSEHHEKDYLKVYNFSFEEAYHEMVKLREYYNIWEENRIKYNENIIHR